MLRAAALTAVGLIPTHAGKTTGSCLRSRSQLGSSPLTRGKPLSPFAPTPTAGLIPTHAGKTREDGEGIEDRPAHPHSRGENHAASTAALNVSGSSPLTRGKHQVGTATVPAERLIPTHAGKTLGRSRRSFPRWAHPHSRGENVKRVLVGWVLSGSSPLTRGKLGAPHDERSPGRLIPTHAGKTRFRCLKHIWGTAHPHSRGENRLAFAFP